MDSTIQSSFDNFLSQDKDLQYEAYNHMLDTTKEEVDWAYDVWDQLKVDWAYDVWDQLKLDLTHTENHRRSRAAQFLCSMAKSDPEKRMLEDFPLVWEVTKDKKFVTARHSLQSIWEIGLAGNEQKEMVIKSIVDRFINCVHEKNYTLIRFDIIQGLRNLFNEIKDNEIKKIALDLIEKEEDTKYQKKYATVWKNT